MSVEAIPYEDLSPDPAAEYSGTGTVEAVPIGTVVSGQVPFDFAPIGSVQILSLVPFVFAPIGGIATALVISGLVPFDLVPIGSPSVPDSPSSDPEGVYRRTGHRPAFPLLVRYVAAPPVPSGLGDGESFLVSLSYVPTPSDGLYEGGALAGYIGTAFGPSRAIVYRAPRLNEVVWKTDGTSPRPDRGMFRWNGSVWVALTTLPQRALRGQTVFAITDPDGICDYYASLIGALGVQSQTDNTSLADLASPDNVPSDYLPLLGYQLGLPDLSSGGTEAYRRQRVRSAVADAKIRATPNSFVKRLAQAGYRGYVREVWVNPDASDNWYSLPAAPSAQQTYASDRGISDDVLPYTGQKGQDWIEVAHGSTRAYPTTHWPSGGLSVHVNRLDGSAIPASTPRDTVSQIKRNVSQLLSDLLPANVYIRMFATDDAGPTTRYL